MKNLSKIFQSSKKSTDSTLEPSFIKWIDTKNPFPAHRIGIFAKPQIYTDSNNKEWVVFLINQLHNNKLSGCLYSIADKNYVTFGNFTKYFYSAKFRVADYYFNTYVIDNQKDILYIWHPKDHTMVKFKITLNTNNTQNKENDFKLDIIERISFVSDDNYCYIYKNKYTGTLNESTIHNFRVYLQFGDAEHMVLVNENGVEKIHIIGGDFTGQHYIFDIKTNKISLFTENICQIKCSLSNTNSNKSNDIDDDTLKIGDTIDARANASRMYQLAKIVDIKGKNTPIPKKDTKLLLDDKKALKRIFVHYIGFDDEFDEWINIDEKGTFCNCIGKCKRKDHRIAPTNSQSRIDIDRHSVNKGKLDYSHRVAVFYCKKLQKVIGFGADWDMNIIPTDYGGVYNYYFDRRYNNNNKNDDKNKPKRGINKSNDKGKNKMFDLQAFFQYTNRKERMGMLIDGYTRMHAHDDGNINIVIHIPKDICGLINRYIFDELCYDFHVSNWDVSNVSITDNYNNEKQNKQIGSKLKDKKSSNINYIINGNFDFTSSFDFVLIDDLCILLIFSREKGIFKFDCEKNILEKIQDCKINYNYISYSRKNKQILLFVAKNVSQGIESRYACIDLHHLLPVT